MMEQGCKWEGLVAEGSLPTATPLHSLARSSPLGPPRDMDSANILDSVLPWRRSPSLRRSEPGLPLAPDAPCLLLALPPEVLDRVFQFFDASALLQLSLVCERFRALAQADSLWSLPLPLLLPPFPFLPSLPPGIQSSF